MKFKSFMQSQYRLLPHANLTELDDEAVVLDLNTGQFYGLNSVGLDALKILERGANFEHLVNEIKTRYGHPTDLVHRDLSLLVEQLVDKGLVGVE